MTLNETLLGALPCMALLDDGVGPGTGAYGGSLAARQDGGAPVFIVLVSTNGRGRRQAPAVQREGELRLGSRTVDLDRCVVVGPAGEERLTAREIQLLRILVRQRGKVVPREELVTAIWGDEAVPGSSPLDVTVYRLRRKLEQDPSDPSWLVSVRGIGLILRASMSTDGYALPLPVVGERAAS